MLLGNMSDTILCSSTENNLHKKYKNLTLDCGCNSWNGLQTIKSTSFTFSYPRYLQCQHTGNL